MPRMDKFDKDTARVVATTQADEIAASRLGVTTLLGQVLPNVSAKRLVTSLNNEANRFRGGYHGGSSPEKSGRQHRRR